MKTVCENKIEELNLLVDGMLDPESRIEIQKHLESCEGCSRYFEDIKALKAGMGKLELKAPSGLAGSIMSEIGTKEKKEKKQKTMKRLYYVSSVAAACLVVAFAVFISGGLGLWSGKSEDLSEALPPEADSGMKNMEQEMEADDGSRDVLGMGGSEESFTITSTCGPGEDVDNGKLFDKSASLEGYSYYTSAFEDNRPVLVNEGGTPIDCSIDKQLDVFFISARYTFDEIEDIVYGEFSGSLNDISTATGENMDYVVFKTDSSTLRDLEQRLELVASTLVEDQKDGILAGISSSIN